MKSNRGGYRPSLFSPFLPDTTISGAAHLPRDFTPQRDRVKAFESAEWKGTTITARLPQTAE